MESEPREATVKCPYLVSCYSPLYSVVDENAFVAMAGATLVPRPSGAGADSEGQACFNSWAGLIVGPGQTHKDDPGHFLLRSAIANKKPGHC